MNFKKRLIAAFLICAVLLSLMPATASYAELYNTQGNDYFTQTSIPTGKTGKTMSVTFTYRADHEADHIYVGIAYDDTVNNSDDKTSAQQYAFPFEASEETLKVKDMGSFKDGQSKKISISAKVRRDISEGYYSVRVYSCQSKDGTGVIAEEYVNIWVKKSTDSDKDDDDDVKDVVFVLGEGQEAPHGVYPNVMNFTLNLRNRGKITAQDVTASIVMDADSTKYPFDINEANYDRHFDKIAYDETVQLPYSMAIRSDVYTGYYPIKIKVTYRESSDGALQSSEVEFYVYVVNKEKEDSQRDFNANDRIKARIIVDSYHTEPAEVYAGQEFTLVVNMKNASTSVPASNLLFTFASEKVSDSPVFTTSNGSDAIAVTSLGSNQITELRINLLPKPSIDQRSYTVSIKEKYDSPEFKNAEEQVDINIPVKQTPRLNVGTIDITPTDINVGDESNIMFPINNTGKVILYNVMAKFEADSIVSNEAYVGNIKPGETGNVDIMLKGAAATMDDGKVAITISYEDENGNESTVEKELTLYVSEAVTDDFAYEDMNMEEAPKTPWYKNLFIIIPAVVLVAAVVAIIIIKRIKKKKADKAIDSSISDGEDDEIL